MYLRKLFFILLLPLAIQACSGGAALQKAETQDALPATEDAMYSDVEKLGRLPIGESYTPSSKSEGYSETLKPILQYTAASGRTCREINVDRSNGLGSKVKVICRKKNGDWYWARDVVLR